MAIDERYILMQDPESYFVDKDSGLPLAGGFIYSYRDDARNVPKTLYQLTGTPGSYTYTALPNPIPLSGVGTPQNATGDNVAVYYYPYITNSEGQEVLDLYYLDVRSATLVEQFVRPAWPNLSTGESPSDAPGLITNELSNAQFSKVLLNSGATTFTFAAASAEEIPIAPDWTLITSGTGSVIVEQVAISGNDGVESSPAYALEITVSSGITECRLNQRFYNNSGLWSAEYLAGSFVAKSAGGTGYSLEMYYAESTPTTSTLIASAALTTSFVRYSPVPVEMPASTNTDTSSTGYVDIYLNLASSTKIQVTSVQVVPTTSGNALPYDQRSSNRELALMSDYYTPRLIAKPIPSLLVGWDFPLNPAQFGSTVTVSTTAAQGMYVWDQTIMSRLNANVAVARNSVTGGLQATTANTPDSFYMMQYLSGAKAKKMLGTRLSVNVSAFKGTVGSDVTCNVYLYRAAAASSFPTLTAATIGSIAASGVFTLTAGAIADGWTEIPRSNLGLATGTLPTVTTATYAELNDLEDLSFSGWEITSTANIADTDKFAIVVTFSAPTTATIITVNSISLVPGDIATRPAPQTADEVLRECQYYYETTFLLGATVPSAVTGGQLIAQMNGSVSGGATSLAVQRSFGGQWVVPKRTTPTVLFYSGTSTTADRAQVFGIGTSTVATAEITISTFFENPVITTKTYYIQSKVMASMLTVTDTSATVPPATWLHYHYTATARLGEV